MVEGGGEGGRAAGRAPPLFCGKMNNIDKFRFIWTQLDYSLA